MKYVPIALVYAWRYSIGLALPPRCKYYPSCSSYAIGALREFGFARGAVLAGWRLLRCNPWSLGGVDFPADQTVFGRRRLRHGERLA